MKKILAINGSARSKGNTSQLLDSFLSGSESSDAEFETLLAHEAQLDYCTGCLRCNLVKRCTIRGDMWPELSRKILDSDVLVFSTPIYFHHVSAQVKKIIDRFRSFVHVQLTEEGLRHTPHTEWNKDFVLLLSLGSSDNADAQPVIDLFEYMVKILGMQNRLHVISANRLAVSKQLTLSKDELKLLYPKLGLSGSLAEEDYKRNQDRLKQCFDLGKKLSQ